MVNEQSFAIVVPGSQPPVAITNPPAKHVTAAMKRAISVGVSVQSLRMLRLACWTVRPPRGKASSTAERFWCGDVRQLNSWFTYLNSNLQADRYERRDKDRLR
jgi:hypothetical protein